MVQSAKSVAPEGNARVSKESEEDSRSHDLQGGNLDLVEVPFSADSQKLSLEASRVDEDYREAQNLK